MTEKEYRSHPAISRSQLAKMKETPEKFWYALNHPADPTPALLFGQVVHKWILQQDDFAKEFYLYRKVNRTTKEGKAKYEEYLADAGDRQMVDASDGLRAAEMKDALMRDPYVKALLSGQHEVPFFWTDPDTGIRCKCRVDCLTDLGDDLAIIDYKTTTDASNEGFTREAIKYQYPLQVAMYSDGVFYNTGRKARFIFIAQEKEPPYAVNIFQADEVFTEKGYDTYREYLGTYKYCRDNNDWYGFLGRERIINDLSLPAWMKGDNQ